MPYEIIPFPISILFAFIFVIAVVVLLWKLRRTSKIYRFLFYGFIIISVFLLIGITLTVVLTPPPIQTRPGVLETEITTDKTSYARG